MICQAFHLNGVLYQNKFLSANISFNCSVNLHEQRLQLKFNQELASAPLSLLMPNVGSPPLVQERV